jgi:predicted nuclease of predicted toxin-antitoxin system
VHTSELPEGNRTTDAQIARHADTEDRVVVTKDADFRDGHLITGSPRRLLVVATGNISNAALLALFQRHLANIVAALTGADFVELRSAELVVHQRPDD